MVNRKPDPQVATDEKLDAAFGPLAGNPVPKIVTDKLAEQLKLLEDEHRQLPTARRAESSGYYAALATFQAQIPKITKEATAQVTGETKDGRPVRYTYRYADLADITSEAYPLLGELGLAWSCRPTLQGSDFVLTYRLHHAPSGEYEEGFWPLPDPRRTKPQEIGSAITYAKRYAFCAVTGIAPAGDDDDAKAAQQAPPRDESWEQAQQRETGAGLPDIERKKLASLSLRDLALRWAATPSGMRGILEPLLGAEFARRIDALNAWHEYQQLMAEIREVGNGDLAKSSERLAWPHEGVRPADRLQARRKELQPPAPSISVAAELEEQIAAAKTPERLDEIEEHLKTSRLTPEEHDHLLAFLVEREKALRVYANAAHPQPAPPTEDAPEPELDPWAQSSVEPADEPAAFGREGTWFYRKIWSYGAGTTEALMDLDGAFERGEVDAQERLGLQALLRERPEDQRSINGLLWRAELALDERGLDVLRTELGEMLRAQVLTADSSRPIYAAVATRRTALGGGRK